MDSLYLAIKPLGIITYSLVFLTALGGLFRKKLPARHHLQIHRAVGITAVVLASIHGALVLYYS